MIEIPTFLSHLRTYRGGIPFTQLWDQGVPDFRAVDMERWAQSVELSDAPLRITNRKLIPTKAGI